MLKTKSINRDLNYLLRRARSSGHGLTEILKTTKAITSKAPTFQQQYGDRIVYATKTIKTAIEAYLTFRYYRCGTKFVHRSSGVPIGGPRSSCLLNLVLASCEDYFDRHQWSLVSQQVRMQGERRKWFSTARYEDDILLMSKSICPRCIDQLATLIYSLEVPWTYAMVHIVKIAYNKFLDMRFAVSFDSLFIDLWHTNIDFAVSGDPQIRKKCRFPPPYGRINTVLDRLSLNFRNRRHRWQQLQLDTTPSKTAALLGFLGLYQTGYEPKIAKKRMAKKSIDRPIFCRSDSDLTPCSDSWKA